MNLIFNIYSKKKILYINISYIIFLYLKKSDLDGNNNLYTWVNNFDSKVEECKFRENVMCYKP